MVKTTSHSNNPHKLNAVGLFAVNGGSLPGEYFDILNHARNTRIQNRETSPVKKRNYAQMYQELFEKTECPPDTHEAQPIAKKQVCLKKTK